MQKNKTYFNILTGCRGWAALLVVWVHLFMASGISQWSFFGRAGHYVVPFFFVLSGFALTHRYYGYRFYLAAFLKERFFRLLPLHWITLLLFIPFYIYFNLDKNIDNFLSRENLQNLGLNLLLLQSVTAYTYPFSFNYPSWSVSTEFYTCLCMGLLFLCVRKTAWRMVAALLIVGLTLYKTPLYYPHLSRHMWLCMQCFFTGVLTYGFYLLLLRRKHLPVWLTFLLELGAAGLLYELVIRRQYQYSGFIFGFFILLLALLEHSRQNANGKGALFWTFLRHPQSLALGRMAYSIYLIHAGVLALIKWLFVSIFREETAAFVFYKNVQGLSVLGYDFSSFTLNSLFAIGALGVVVGFACLCYLWVERPMRNKVPSVFRSRRLKM